MNDLPRSVVLSGASNVRDLGGWPAEGGRVRFGRVFRGAALSGLTEADAEVLSGLGVRIVCDLRGTEECAAAPTRLAGVTIHSLPIEPSVGASLRDIAATRAATGEDALVLMRQAYVAYAMEWGHRYRAMFDLLADAPGALLLHCSAGKDRTGFGAALILTALGVPREAVMQDYLASNRLWRGDASMAVGLPPEMAAHFLLVRAELLEAALAAIDEAHGGFERYAEAELGLDTGKRQRLRDRLIERVS
ncbi:MAG TPA: tyrosine-protein phosphatase [Acetobacteraceae bacterium]